MKVEEFISSREGLSEERVTILRYLDAVCDVVIEPAKKGRSAVRCRFDAGAYKGHTDIKLRYDTLNPIAVAAILLSVGDGWSFSFAGAERAIIDDMQKQILIAKP